MLTLPRRGACDKATDQGDAVCRGHQPTQTIEITVVTIPRLRSSLCGRNAQKAEMRACRESARQDLSEQVAMYVSAESKNACVSSHREL